MVSPKWQTMWIESQHCSKSIVNMPLPAQQAKKILEDLKTSCCSPNKAVQVEALKCWGLWIHNQNPEDWKLNTICFTAVRPLITKKLQPLHKDVDICKLKLSLMWALLVKVQDLMQLEGPQYILEVFLQSCLSWLSSASGDDSEKDIFLLIFQLLLAVFNKNETLTGCDKEMFPPLSSNVLHIKAFHLLADKFLNLFIYWRKVEDKSVILKIWRHFLEYCEQSYEHIPIPVWHKVFKLAGQICSEKDEPVKERLAFLHSCATTLKSALSSSKFIDFGNLLTTPCEVLLKKLVELCTIECNEFRDSEMFLHSKEICQVLSNKSVAINGYDLCISVLDVLEEFCLRSLFWGVWCGLVYCYKALLVGTHQSQLTKIQMKFYRKLRGVVVNFELDRKALHEDCVKEVEKYIGFLNISCLCSYWSGESAEAEVSKGRSEQSELREEPVLFSTPRCVFNGVSNKIVPVIPKCALGQFSLVPLQKRKNLPPRRGLHINFDLIEDVLSTLSVNSAKSLLGSMFTFRYMSTQTGHHIEIIPRTLSLPLNVEMSNKKEMSLTVSFHEEKPPSPKAPCTPVKKNAAVRSEADHKAEIDEEVISTPTTRSKKRAEEERKRELELQKRRKRKSFEVIVQEIVRKNKERKTEKNNKRKKSQDGMKGKRTKRKIERQPDKENQKVGNLGGKGNKSSRGCDRKLRNSKKGEEAKIEKVKGKNPLKIEGKLENYFKVIRKKLGNEANKEVKRPSKAKKEKKKKKKKKRTSQSSCCKPEKEEGERSGEIGWRQTSLKTMMNPKSKVEKVKQEIRTRDKTRDLTEEKPKGTNDSRKVLGRPPAKLSPRFKEVFHDHEYAKKKPPEKINTLGRVVVAKNKKKTEERRPEKEGGKIDFHKTSKPELLVTKKKDCLETKAFAEAKCLELEKTETGEKESSDVEASPLLVQISTSSESEETELTTLVESNLQKVEIQEATEYFEIQALESRLEESKRVDEEEAKKPSLEVVEENLEIPPKGIELCSEENPEDPSENKFSFDKRGRKRVRALEVLKSNKKMRLEEEEEEEVAEDPPLPLEVTEKENLEEKQLELVSPMKREKALGLASKRSGSPKAVSSGMSRALRIIGLVPESTKGRSWESPPRMEALKCIKAPNVDKNSRASKMLALLSENIMETDEVIITNEEEVNSSIAVATTPNAKTPLSSMKSPKSIKKRRSIRFDDARNETVLYQIDTPPSQILEEREKCRGMRPFEIALHLP